MFGPSIACATSQLYPLQPQSIAPTSRHHGGVPPSLPRNGKGTSGWGSVLVGCYGPVPHPCGLFKVGHSSLCSTIILNVAQDFKPVTAPYDKLYEHFDSPLMRQLRAEAYGQDIGQHSWVTAEELLGDIPKLKLSPESCLLDLGCGPAGPLTFIAAQTKCQAVGLDVSANAIAAPRARPPSPPLSYPITLHHPHFTHPPPFPL